MALGLRFVCEVCHKAIEAWSDGNPYYFDEAGVKQYAYHPNHERLDRCIGNEVEHLCLSCGAEFRIDSLAPIAACPECRSAEIAITFDLAERDCPFCKKGKFRDDPDYLLIS